MKRCCSSRKSTTRHLAAGVVPGLILLLMPKCPACLAAYFAFGAGLSLTLSDAAALRVVLLTLSALALVLLAVSLFRQNHHPSRS